MREDLKLVNKAFFAAFSAFRVWKETDYNGFGGGKPCTIFCNCLMGGMDKLVCPCKKRQCKVRKELS
ncbi:MAG: hypothetical protein U9O82_09650, partial [Thermodesulfobacteriota bacterium]|nr:hypothetical protein [Thermodesulfobacteriota bacterium]